MGFRVDKPAETVPINKWEVTLRDIHGCSKVCFCFQADSVFWNIVIELGCYSMERISDRKYSAREKGTHLLIFDMILGVCKELLG